MRIVLLVFIGCHLCFGPLHASSNDSISSDTITAHLILKRIETLQSKSDYIFPVGSFESYREYTMNKGQVKADFNAFYTGLICFTLRDLLPYLNAEDQQLAKQIIKNAIPSIELFKNKNGRNTYNFWSGDKQLIFPNSGWLNWLDKAQSLPDDFDDTVISLLALDTDQETAKKVHELMQKFVNGAHHKIRNTYPAYEKMPVYSTWFGVKMPVDFDVSVLCNVLYFVHKYQLPYTKADSASLDLIVQIIRNKQHITDAAYISPHYKRLPIILYHLSRLMQSASISSLEPYRAGLIADAYQALKESHHLMDQVLLTTALRRWGENPPTIQIAAKQSILNLIEEEDFSFFIANMSSILPNPYKRMATNAQLGMFNYYCAAYNQVLMLENLVWKKRHDLTLQKNK